jgi:hypothetical protein
MKNMELVWIIKAAYVKDYIINITFNNGVNGPVDFSSMFNLPIYEPLKKIDYFKSFKLNSWTLEWANGADYAPEFLYKLLSEQTDRQLKNKKVIA